MRLLISVLLFAALVGQLVMAERDWETYKRDFGKFYDDSGEDASRRENYFRTLEVIKTHNNANYTSKMGENYMSDWTAEEVSRLFSVLKPSDHPTSNDTFFDVPVSKLALRPESIDLSERKSRVGPVKRQPKCGSSWAFAVTGLLEGILTGQNAANWKLEALSERQILECQREGGKFVSEDPCKGGSIAFALDNIMKMGGLQTDAGYVHQPHKQCQFNKSKSEVEIQSYKEVDMSRLEDFSEFSIWVGPVAAYMTAPVHFENYKSGIITQAECDPDAAPNHAVLIVGYTKEYYKVKNSWGEDWGQNGYFWIEKGNTCGILKHIYRVLRKPRTPVMNRINTI